MKKKILLSLTTIIAICTCAFTLTACGHTHSYKTKVTMPTCTEKGYTTYTCDCNDSYVSDYIDELGHDYGEYVYDDNASCEQDGTKTASCSRHGCTQKNTIIEEGSKLIQVKAYIDGELYATLFTSKKQNYKIKLPEQPQDITTNMYIEKYFYGWFSDEYCSLPVKKEQSFETNSSIYAKWIKTDSSVFKYKVSNGEAIITGRKDKTQTLLVIPPFINSFPVKSVGYEAFTHETTIKKIIICDGVETIEGYSFYSCESLKEIFMPSSLKNIGFESFAHCNSLEAIEIPNSVTSIGASAFGFCYSLIKIRWDAISCVFDFGNDTLKYDAPFMGLTPNITDVIIGEKVEYIDVRIFMDKDGAIPWSTKFKSFVFENPKGWYEYKIYGDNIVDCSMIEDINEDINIAFVQNYDFRYGKKEYHVVYV